MIMYFDNYKTKCKTLDVRNSLKLLLHSQLAATSLALSRALT